jgi:NADPH2:quinone reductase
LLDLYGKGSLKPVISQTFALEDYVAAFQVFSERQAMGKVVLSLRAD